MKTGVTYKSDGIPFGEFSNVFGFQIEKTIERLGNPKLLGLRWINEIDRAGWILEYEAA